MRLIDADALKARLKGCVIILPKGEKCMADRAIDTQGTIESEPVKHGAWIDTPVPAENTFVAKCSVCGFWQRTNSEDKTGKHLIHKAVYRYCAGCGAKMDATDTNVGGKYGGADNG